MANPFRNYEAEIFDLKTGRHLSSMCTSTREEGEPYRLGEEIPLSDSVIYQNNSKRARRCFIRKTEKLPMSKPGCHGCYKIFVEPSKQEAVFSSSPLNPLDSGDWQEKDGYDGWLNPSSE